MKVVLAQTDTTVGFLSQDSQKLFEIKSRKFSKQFLKIYRNFKVFSSYKNRVPQSQKRLFRRSKKTTFIIKNRASRVVDISQNSKVLQDLDWFYSTSANKTDQSFDFEFCQESVDVVVERKVGLSENSSSRLLKINNKKVKRLR